jgi:hypothetical protein
VKFRKGCGAQNTGVKENFMKDKTVTKMADCVQVGQASRADVGAIDDAAWRVDPRHN